MRVALFVALLGALIAVAPARAADPPLELERVTVSDLQAKMAAGQLTSVQLTREYIDRIAAVNARGPGIHAVRLVNPRALQDASVLDLERATGHVRGPLHGIPVLVKDHLDAGLPTTAGTNGAPATVPDYLSGLKTDALNGKRIGVISSSNARYPAAITAIQALGATTVTVTSPSSSAPFDILTPEFKRDINAYVGRLPATAPMKSLADIVAYNSAHADEAIKWGQGQLNASQATDLTDPAQNAAYTTARDKQRADAQAAIDKVLTDNTLDALMTTSGR